MKEYPAWLIFLVPRALSAGPVGLMADIVLWVTLAAFGLKAAGWY